MPYPLENLNDEKFQLLCQALLAKENPGVQCFPVGQPDGGRDAVQRDTSVAKKFLVYQVKFVRDPSTIEDPRKWLLEIVKSEIDKVRSLVDRSATGYFILTNVSGSAHPGTGSIDRMEELLTEKLQIPSMCWWRNDIERRLDSAWDIKWAYPEVMSGPDFLRLIFESGLKQEVERRKRAIQAFLRDQYNRDSDIRFRQVELQNALLDLFVDVPVLAKSNGKSDRDSHAFQLAVQRIQSDGEHEELSEQRWYFTEHDYQPHIGAAVFLLNGRSVSDFKQVVIEGAPGQGKSTVSQYICQVHRIKLLQLTSDLERLPRRDADAPMRLPMRVDLRDFAEWMRGRDPFAANKSLVAPVTRAQLEPFLASLISHHAGGVDFSVDDLIAVCQVSAVSLVLDGLDEVADIQTRISVVEEITAGTQRLSQNAASLQTIVTTRPTMFSDTPGMPETKFRYLTLQSLTPELIKQYAERWAKARKVLPEVQFDIQEFIRTKLGEPHIRDLARNAMQLTILLNLVQAKGAALPEKRTALYQAYMENFIAREAAKNLTVREYRDVILDLHQYVAWVMHSEAEQEGGRGDIHHDRLVSLVEKYLEREGRDPSIADKIFRDMVDRVLALVSRTEGTFEFEVQPLREYFAAKFLFETAPLSSPGNERAGSVPDRFEAIARRAYWLNVARFYAGCYSKGEIPSLVNSIRDLLDDQDWGLTTAPAQLASALLSDWVFAQLPKQVTEVVNLMAERKTLLRLAGLHYVHHYRSSDQGVLKLPDECGSPQLVSKIYTLLESKLPFVHEMSLLNVVETNTNDSEANVANWLNQCTSTTGASLSRMLRYGRIVGALQKVPSWELEKLPIECRPDHVSELYWAGRDDVLIGSMQLFDEAKRLLLDARLGSALFDSESCLRVLNLGIDYSAYAYGLTGAPTSLAAALDSATGGVAAKVLSREISPADESMLVGITEFSKVMKECFSLPLKEWLNSQAPWARVIGCASEIWGERRAIQLVGIAAASVRINKRSRLEHADLTSPASPLWERTRFARLHAKDLGYWSAQLRSAVHEQDRLFVALCCLTFCPIETLAILGEDLSAAIEALPVSEWRWLYSRFGQIRDRSGRKNGTGIGPIGDQRISERLACALAQLTTGTVRRELIKHYLISSKDACAQGHRLWLALDVQGAGTRKWNPDLDDVQARVREDGRLTYQDWRRMIFGRGAEPSRLTLEMVRRILGNPESFPPELTGGAEKKLRTHIGRHTTSLAAFAKAQHWGLE